MQIREPKVVDTEEGSTVVFHCEVVGRYSVSLNRISSDRYVNMCHLETVQPSLDQARVPLITCWKQR